MWNRAIIIIDRSVFVIIIVIIIIITIIIIIIMIIIIIKYQLHWTGHFVWIEDSRIPKVLFYNELQTPDLLIVVFVCLKVQSHNWDCKS